METRSNQILVGSVVLGLIAALAVFMVWLSQIGDGANEEYDVFFQQSVEGLAKGSAVTLQKDGDKGGPDEETHRHATETIERGKNSGLFGSSGKWTDSQRTVVKAMMEDIYDQFTSKAAEGRKMPVDQLRKLGAFKDPSAKPNGKAAP